MIKYLKKVWHDFYHSKPLTKVFIGLFIALEIFVMVITFGKVNYEVYTPGVLNNAQLSVEVTTDKTVTDRIYTVGIYTYKPISIIQYWLANHDKQLELNTYNPETELDSSAETQFGITSKRVSINYALMQAYKAAREYEIRQGIESTIHLENKYEGLVVSAILPYANTDLKCDDIITHINGVALSYGDTTYSDAYNAAKESLGTLTFTVNRNDVVLNVNAKFVEVDDNKMLGISMYHYFSVDPEKSTPQFSIVDQYISIGSSGSSMLTLSIFNHLIADDITDGKLICGTGTINLDGTLGAIAGIEQKVLTAKLYNVDVFFVDEDESYFETENDLTDYELALAACEKHGINSDFIVGVKTFDDIIKYLEGMKND